MLALLSTISLAGPLDGTYVLAESPAEVDAKLKGVVDAATASFPTMIQGIARGRLEGATHLCTTYVLQASASHWSNQCDDLPALERPLDGTSAPVTVRDKDVEVSVQREGDTVTQVLRGASGTRTNAFRFDGDALILTVTVAADHLDTPMVWTLRYQRA